MSESKFVKSVTEIVLNGTTYTCRKGERAIVGDNTMALFRKADGLENDVVLCPDVNAENPQILHRVENPGTGSYQTAEVYAFESYGDAEGTEKYADGTVETTGTTKAFDEVEYTEVVVTENSVPGFTGNRYYIVSTAEVGDTLYELLNADGTSASIWVKLV